MKTIYLVMMTIQGSNNWKPVHSWESRKSAIKAIKNAVTLDKMYKYETKFKYTIKEIHLFLDLEIPY